jgi:thiamine-phosphate pyrophosphorylase
MSLVRDLADQIVAAHSKDDLCLPIPAYSMSSPPPRIDNEHAADHYELAGMVAAIEMGFIECDAKVLAKAWSRMVDLIPLNGHPDPSILICFPGPEI